MKPITWVAIILFGLAGIMLGEGLWRRFQHPPHVLSTGLVTVVDKWGAKLSFPKRVVAVGGFEITEVELPYGTWLDCGGDCDRAIKREHLDTFDERLSTGR